METIIVLTFLVLSTESVQSLKISKVMRNAIRCRTEQRNSEIRRQELEILEMKLKSEKTLSYPELRDLISAHFKLDSQTTRVSQTKDEDIVMGEIDCLFQFFYNKISQCNGYGSEWVDI